MQGNSVVATLVVIQVKKSSFEDKKSQSYLKINGIIEFSAAVH